MTEASPQPTSPSDVLLAADHDGPTRPIWVVRGKGLAGLEKLSEGQRRWLEETGFKGKAKQLALVPGPDGGFAGAAFGVGEGRSGEPCGPSDLLVGQLAKALPAGTYAYAGGIDQPELAAMAFGLGAYSFRRYKSSNGEDEPARLKVSEGVDLGRVLAVVEAVWLARDLINTPASDMGPVELEAAVREVGTRHGAQVTAVIGDDLLTANFPMIHAVGRASPRQPRLIDLRWGREDAPRVTLVGKGICFDTGGLDIKPASGMLLMKKDMGGAATAIALGSMIMALGLDVRLRVLISAAENSVAGNAFRPRDVIRARDGRTVEIGNTDAEGRLVLSDALTLADEEAPDTVIAFSTLTGAARVALGAELPPCYTDDDGFAAEIVAAGEQVGDPVWRMPFWDGYERNLDSDVADMNNVSEGAFGGSITAALFLRRFVKAAARFAHFDIYGWRQAKHPLGPKGGEPQAARAVLQVLESRYGRVV